MQLIEDAENDDVLQRQARSLRGLTNYVDEVEVVSGNVSPAQMRGLTERILFHVMGHGKTTGGL